MDQLSPEERQRRQAAKRRYYEKTFVPASRLSTEELEVRRLRHRKSNAERYASLDEEARRARNAAAREGYAARKARDPNAVREQQQRNWERNGSRWTQRLREYRQQHREDISKYHREYRLRHKARVRDSWLRAQFGISLPYYDALLAAQGGVCATCRRPERRKRGNSAEATALHVDHCHRTGRVRGILCASCNTALGLLADDIDRVVAAAAYLEGHNR
jgi:hypothetical protein